MEGDRMTEPGPYLTLDEAAELLHVSRWKLFVLIKSRELASFKPGKRRLIPLAAIHAYAERLMEEAA
jgi:excisionase family DNA binding protein